jgi:hypothetical protein
MKRLLMLTAACYLFAALIARLLENAGMYECGCDADCWCKRPGLSLFGWVFPRGHKGSWTSEQKRELDL